MTTQSSLHLSHNYSSTTALCFLIILVTNNKVLRYEASAVTL